MEECELQPFAHLEELSYHLVSDIIKALNKEDNWLMIARDLRNGLGEYTFSEEEISHMKRNQNPGQALLDKLKCHNLQIREFQNILKSSQLFSILNKIITNVPVKINAPVGDVHQNIKLGESIDIVVDVDGSPYPEFQWYFNERLLQGQTSWRLPINKFSNEQMGVYFCQMSHILKGEVKEYRSFKFILNIEIMPPEITVDLRDVELLAGRELLLSFEAMGYPEPESYTWYKNNEFFAITSEPKLKIQEVDSLVSGSYHCEVRNNKGSCTSRAATVKVVSPVRVPVVPVFNRKISASEDNHRHNLESIIRETILKREDRDPSQLQFSALSPISTLLYDDVGSQVRCTQEEPLIARNKWALMVANTDYMQENTKLKTPINDMKVLARELIKPNLQFRVMMYSNLKRTEFVNAVHLFKKFLNKGDYVVFYFAGHGFNNNGIDFMMPLDARMKCIPREENVETPPNEVPCQGDCIATTTVTNDIQDTFPALLFSVYDSCRSQLSCRMMLPATTEKYIHALANSFTLFATSENYDTFEDNNSSMLMAHLKKLVGEPIPVEVLGQKVKESFHHKYDKIQNDQIPKTVCDLGQPRSLTDPSVPLEEDTKENGVLQNWEKLGSLGGVIEADIRVAHADIRVNIQCIQEALPDAHQFPRDGPTWVISNCIQVLITLSQNNELFDATVVDKDGLDLIIKFSTNKEIYWKLKGRTKPIVCHVDGIQTLEGCLILELFFVFKEVMLCQKVFNLQKPSISKGFSLYNDLS